MVDGLPRAPNEDISKSMNPIDSGAISQPRSDQELSRNVFVVSVYAFEQGSSWRISFCMPPKNQDFHEISNFRETSREGSGKLLGCLESVLECLRASKNDFRTSIRSRKNVEIFEIFSTS